MHSRLPSTMIQTIDRARKYCLSRGDNNNSSKKALASWDKAYRPKMKGGMRAVNLKIQNEALLKHLHKFYNKHDLPWVKLI